ncbi:esterase/lipase family protein [Epibacterium ulvae]|uniref:esterase/lipase family protein n=1 Tax=Epibacterium ulvae TaxID=1156985 RepID=UPI002492240A|nr:alpha/beta fold hydrolase [Epibacterium ulvae]
MRLWSVLSLIAGVVLCAPIQLHAAQKDCVVLLHGLARTKASFTFMQIALEEQGYRVVRPNYPSTKFSVEELSRTVVPRALAQCGSAPTYAVTHSMGGILLRVWLEDNPEPHLKRVVMLAPPNHGSEVVDRFGDWWLFDRLNGPAGAELGTDVDSLPSSLPPVQFELGVIAGRRSFNPLFSSVIPGTDDGKVSVQSTYVAGMQAHITLPVTHTYMMNDPVVIAQVLSFLKHARFDSSLRWGQSLRQILNAR